MARIKSRMPQGWGTLAPEHQESYLADLDRVAHAVDDVSSTATLSDLITAFNLLLAKKREAGQMKS
jgi:hypothetical protein